MRSWPSPHIPDLPGAGRPVRVHDTARGELVTLEPGPVAGLYVCGITPYDATHLGHAATYVTFDVLQRALRDAGQEVRYVQNVTDVDDPLLARAVRDGVDWEQLADRETELFREDMTALSVLAPDHYLGVTESIGLIVDAVTRLLADGAAYRLEAPDASQPGGADVYLDISQRPGFGAVSGASRTEMLDLFGERGGDPDREGKRDPLDPLLWRAERDGEPAWGGGTLGSGRPGWHIECTAIAVEHLGVPFLVQGGGSDLVFPHHEMSAVQGCALTGTRPFAEVFVHQAMVGLDGEKMSKSKGNLVLVSALREQGVDPMAIRLALLDHHYRTEWEWTQSDLLTAQLRLARWRAGLSVNGAPEAGPVVAALRERVADDLDTPAALDLVDEWARAAISGHGDDPVAPGLVARAVDRLLGVRL
ncbi:MAG TPA: cysteine--1-D-myo-inosityl 2-amino-2-deoxy-alpha-D-glucopyranoside ligase [Dermatophilaceae bacterium]|nr:cysteine--1-D-myo-inosityl 2-amino-2-deoxy-alpha-D-glucopyranoside ligase [Dermatophilaceae bacterium]